MINRIGGEDCRRAARKSAILAQAVRAPSPAHNISVFKRNTHADQKCRRRQSGRHGPGDRRTAQGKRLECLRCAGWPQRAHPGPCARGRLDRLRLDGEAGCDLRAGAIRHQPRRGAQRRPRGRSRHEEDRRARSRSPISTRCRRRRRATRTAWSARPAACS